MNRAKLDEVIRTRLKEMQQYRISLDADPLAAGLGSFNKKIAEAREYTNRVASIVTSAILVKREAQAAQGRAKAEFERALNTVLASDPRVYDAPEGQRSSQELRRANALQILKDDGVGVEDVLGESDDFLHTANMFYETAKTVYENLNETRKDLLYQISVIRTQVAIGEVHADPLITKSMFQGGLEEKTSGSVEI
jgi:hypothetical protein